MSLRKLHDDPVQAGVDAQQTSVPKVAASGDFVYAEFRHRSQVLRVAVLCPTCFARPEWTMSPEETLKGYNVRSHKYLDGDRRCYDCDAEPGA